MIVQGCLNWPKTGRSFSMKFGETPLAIQVKLLRVLESRNHESWFERRRTTNARLLQPLTGDLQVMIATGHFAKTLYHRLKVFSFETAAAQNSS